MFKDRNRKGYLIHESGENNFCICKILNEHDSLEDAKRDLVDLLSKSKTEKQILREYSNKNIFS